MGYRVTLSDPEWTFDVSELERQVATFAKANGKTTQAQWDAFVASLTTTAQAVAVVKGLLSAFKCSAP
jgi:hypothetical protein